MKDKEELTNKKKKLKKANIIILCVTIATFFIIGVILSLLKIESTTIMLILIGIITIYIIIMRTIAIKNKEIDEKIEKIDEIRTAINESKKDEK